MTPPEPAPILLKVFQTPDGRVMYQYWQGATPISETFGSLDLAAAWLKGRKAPYLTR